MSHDKEMPVSLREMELKVIDGMNMVEAKKLDLEIEKIKLKRSRIEKAMVRDY